MQASQLFPSLNFAEKLWLPLGPFLGGYPNGCVLLHGSALVRGSYGHLHRTHWLFEDGEWEQCHWGAATVPRSQVGLPRLRLYSSWFRLNSVQACVSREQRLTGILVFVLTGLSVFLAPILQVLSVPFFTKNPAQICILQHLQFKTLKRQLLLNWQTKIVCLPRP